MSRYKYSDSEKEILKVLKKQEGQLETLEVNTHENTNELSEIRKRIEALAKKRGINLPSTDKNIINTNYEDKIETSEIPSWQECLEEAIQIVPHEVVIEDLLSKDEFQFCIDEAERIETEFSKKTGILNKKDLSFLFVATALQTARWLIIQELCGDLGETIDEKARVEHNDNTIKKETSRLNKKFQEQFEDHGHNSSLKSYKSWEQIIFSSAPYDTTVGTPALGINMEGKYHRYKTLGHDPILGWIFGTANFITDTCTLSDFSSYRISRVGTPHFAEPTNLATIFYEVFDSIKEDWLRLPAGIFAQYVHLKSDVFTKLGLPVPLLEAFSDEIAGELYKSQYDSLCLLKDVKIIGKQAAWSILINMVIGLIHGLLYNPHKDGDRKFYEARTRKILCISNSLATTVNIVYAIGTEDWKKLDIGGMMVTLYRLFSDIRFVTRLKKEFISNKMDKVLENEIKEIDSHFT